MAPGTLIAFLVSLVLQVGFPLTIAIVFHRRTRASWHLFAYGAIIFAVFQLFTWLPLSVYIDYNLTPRITSQFGAFVWLMALAFTTSLIEELGRFWGYRYLFPRQSFRLTWTNGVMYALGHASLETVLLIAGLTFVYFLAYLILSRLNLAILIGSMGSDASPGLENELRTIMSTSWDQPLTVAVERLLALPHQVAWSLLVMQSLIHRQKRWFVFSVLYHFSVAVIVPGMARLSGFVAAETVNALLAALSTWIILRLRLASPEER